MAHFKEFEVRNGQRAGAGAGVAAMNLPAEKRVPKARKPYTISKQREKWTEDEHKLFLESLQLHGRAWRRIQEHIGSKTAVQIRSHAQKFFSKVTRESSADGNALAAAPQIRIPPPRPKKKPAYPYPRKLGNHSPAKDAPSLKQLHKPQPQLRVVRSSYEQENCSPKSVLTVAQIGSETPASDSVRSPASSVDVEVSCHAPKVTAVEVTNDKTVSENVMCGIPESPVLRLFGERVVVNHLHHEPKSTAEKEQNVADMELDESTETPTSRTAKLSSHSAAEANTLSPWQNNTNQYMYYLPRGKVLFVPSDCQFFSYNNGSIACNMLDLDQQGKKQQRHQPSQAADCRFTSGEGSCSESITTASGMPETPTQNSDSVESIQVTNNKEEEMVLPGPRKCVSPTPDCLRGFVPYKKCTAESKIIQFPALGEEADREMTRLCLYSSRPHS